MKLSQNKKIIFCPKDWNDIPYGIHYKKSLENNLNMWWPKLFGFNLLKIGTLSIDLNISNCNFLHQFNIGIEGNYLHVIADPYALPFADNTIDACLLVHTLSYTNNPFLLLKEIHRILSNDGWIIITTFNLLSILGLKNIFSLFKKQYIKNRFYTQIELLHWLYILNFTIEYRAKLQVLPCMTHGKFHLLNDYLSYIGCLHVIIARKHTSAFKLIPFKHKYAFN